LHFGLSFTAATSNICSNSSSSQQQQQQQIQQQQHQHSSRLCLTLTTSNLLLTPTHTPSSLGKQDPLQHPLLLGQFAGSEQMATNNFLQSSTVTSTPIEREKAATPAPSAGATAGNLSAAQVKFEQESADDDEDDDKPLSSLTSCSSSGHTNASSEKLLLSGVHPLESTTDSLDSPSMVSDPGI